MTIVIRDCKSNVATTLESIRTIELNLFETILRRQIRISLGKKTGDTDSIVQKKSIDTALTRTHLKPPSAASTAYTSSYIPDCAMAFVACSRIHS
jgi:hypothetical protein